MSVKDCGHHEDNKKDWLKKIAIGVLIFIVLVLLIIFIVWLILRPTKPVFVLEDATVYAFNLSGSPPNLLTSTFQLTVQSRNPNDRISIYYDHLIVYATYRSQQITVPTSIPTTYQDNNGVNIWSPFVTGVLVPIAPFIGSAMKEDQSAGNLPMNIKMDGKVRWRVGAITTASYRLHVDCPALLAVGNPHSTTPVGYNTVKYQLTQRCGVSV